MNVSTNFTQNSFSFDVAKLKANQGPLTGPIADALKQLGGEDGVLPDAAKMKEIEAQAKKRESRVDEVNHIYDHLIAAFSKSGDAEQVARLKKSRQRSLEEARFEDKHGFARQVTGGAEGLYRKAQNGTLGGFSPGSKKSALYIAGSLLSNLAGFAREINRHGFGDPSLDGGLNEEKARGPVHEVPEDFDGPQNFIKLLVEHNQSTDEAWAKNGRLKAEDRLTAARMYLEVESQVLANTFGIDEPIFEVSDGQLKIREFDIEFGGEKILRSLGNGAKVEYGADGALTVDKYA